jgi:subtilase family protein
LKTTLLVGALLLSCHSAALAGTGGPPVPQRSSVLPVVAVLDTGVHWEHPEFVGEQGSRITAWFDFTRGLPRPDETWDAFHPVPNDSCPAGSGCHGTAMAFLVAGKAYGSMPGTRIAVAKVVDEEGQVVHLEQAIAWAVETVGARVLSISLGTNAPTLSQSGLDRALERAFELGALPVVAAGNGFGGSGIRYPSFLASPAGSPHALVVGAAGWGGSTEARMLGASFSNTDPDVLAWGVRVPAAWSADGAALWSGTSVATALVAGWAGRVVVAADAAGVPIDPARLTKLLAWTADDNPEVPPTFEGFGLLDDARSFRDTVGLARAYAASGEDPPPPLLVTSMGAAAADVVRSEMYAASVSHDEITQAGRVLSQGQT